MNPPTPSDRPPIGPTRLDRVRVEAALDQARVELLGQRNAQGHWTGQLSASALSTATAVVALALARREGRLPEAMVHRLIDGGLDWLVRNQNPDGGWGDTVRSRSNLSTTTLVWAAMGMDNHRTGCVALQRAESWLWDRVGTLQPAGLASKIIARYGRDRTFSVPILTLCALAGRMGSGPSAWKAVIPLPFELAAFPQAWFAALRLPVVSYALPALIAVGYARHFHAPTGFAPLRWLRSWVKRRVFRVLDRIQPPNGGFLEATPLTSFVVMSLLGSGEGGQDVVRRGLDFLVKSVLPDGSWAIDTNLATWVTSLSIQALGHGPGGLALSPVERERILNWLLGQQYRVVHPYTGAPPGGWAWTDLPGGVPDADDTPGALLALHALAGTAVVAAPEVLLAVEGGMRWLFGLQNRDGGIPTFCRGWGRLPFDRSSADLTAHALRAWQVWGPVGVERGVWEEAKERAVAFLERVQGSGGWWEPLWFGNEAEEGETNRVYGTSRVVLALAETGLAPGACRRGAEWLMAVQKADGGWSGGEGLGASSVEETALALEALLAIGSVEVEPVVERGLAWLVGRVEDGSWKQPAAIGFYFAKLWYFEALYPRIFTVAALGRMGRLGRIPASL